MEADYDNSEPMEISERYEQLIAFLGSQLPAPVEQQPGDDGSIIFTGGAPAEVVAHLTASSVIVCEFAGVWESTDTFVVRPRRVGLVKWRRLSETAVMNTIAIRCSFRCPFRMQGPPKPRLPAYECLRCPRATARARTRVIWISLAVLSAFT